MIRSGYGIRISQFIQVDEATGANYLTMVVDGTNVKISVDDFVAGLGVTGSLAQIGDGLVNILDIQGSANFIRNIENGPGILAEVTPDEGIKISQNFTVDASGAPLVINTTSASPTIRSLVAGAGVTITPSGNTLIISSP